MLFITKLKMCVKQCAQLEALGKSTRLPTSPSIILLLLNALLQVMANTYTGLKGMFSFFFFEHTLSLIPKSSRTFSKVIMRLNPICKCAHSIISSSKDLAVPSVSKCVVTVINTWPLGEVHASITKFRIPSYACA